MRTVSDRWHMHWLTLAQRWQHHLVDAGLGEIAHSVGHAFKPLAPLAAQVLWLAQPGFAIFGHAEAIGTLAELLDDPDISDHAAQSGMGK